MDRRPGWYTWIVLLVVMVLSPIASAWIGVQVAQRSQCDLYRSNLAVYREEPPPTRTGKALQRTYEQKIKDDCGGK